DDDLRIFPELGLGQLALEKLGGAAQPAERVANLVREVADQLAVRVLLGHEALLARLAQLLLDGPQLGEEPQLALARPLRVDARQHARKRNRLAPAAAEADVLRR